MPGLQSALLTMAAAVIVTAVPAMGLPGPRAPREKIAAPPLLDQHNSSGKRMALLIGVSDYPGTDSDLDGGPLNDVMLMSALLQEKLGFAESEIMTLTDGKATRENIIAAFKDSLAKVPSDGIVVVYFSGHGGQLEDDDGDELDKLDEVIIVRNRDPNKVAIFRDEELSALESYLPAGRILFLLDNCYSGTGTRGQFRTPAATDVLGEVPARAQFRNPPANPRGGAQPKLMAMRSIRTQLSTTTGPVTRRAGASQEPSTHLLLAASAETETAINMPLRLSDRSTVNVGLFTAALYRTLHAPDFSGQTFAELGTKLRTVAKATTGAMKVGLQTPQVEGTMRNVTLGAFFGIK